MGVHGLTTFIDGLEKTQQGDYREVVYLCDKPVVIDGCNLMYHLYFSGKTPVVGKGKNKSAPELDGKTIPNAHLYGGDWMHYAQNVRYFFQHLQHCRITAIVIFDGAYDATKLQIARSRFEKTVYENVKSRSPTSAEEPGSTYTLVFLKNVFLEVIKEQKVAHYQTIGEADPTIAMVAKLLGSCIILSSDSDFYIYSDATPISLKTLKFAQKQPKAENILTSDSEGSSKGAKKVWVLIGENVSLSKICEKEFGLKNQEMLPLAAVIIGNDSIMCPGVFKSIKQGDCMTKRIESVLKWLAKQRTVGLAFKNLISFVPVEKQTLVEAALMRNLEMYNGEDGEKRIWERIKEDVDVSRWTDYELEKNVFKSKFQENCDDLHLHMENLTVSLGSEESIKCVVHQQTKESDPEMNDMAKISCDNNGNLQAEVVSCSVPEWYRLKHINCEFQTYLLNILKNKVVFLPPQVEMYGQLTTHDFSIPIIRATAGILLGEPDAVVILESHLNGRVSRIKMLPSTKLDNYGPLPTLRDHEKSGKGDITKYYSHEKKLNLLFAVLHICEMKENSYTFYDGWPVSYRIWITTLMYYIRMKLHLPRGFVEPLKNIAVITSIFLCIIKNLIYNPGKISETPGNKCLTAICALLNVTSTCPDKMKNIRDFYDRFEEYSFEGGKRKSKKTTYDINIPYNLSQYLCIVYHTEMLNNLLGNPLQSPKVRYTINNYFIYNFSRYLIGKTEGIDHVINFNAIIQNATGVVEMREVLHEFLGFCFGLPKVLKPDTEL